MLGVDWAPVQHLGASSGWVPLGAPSFWREMKPHEPMELSDEFILELTQAQQRLFGYIFRRVANRDQAMEVLQQTNLVLCHKADDFKLGTNFRAWSSTVAHYQILSYRSSLRRDRLVFTDEVMASLDERENESEMREGVLSHLRHCLEAMSSDNQVFIKLRYEGGLSMQQIAIEVDKAAGAVKVKLHRLRRSLRDCVQNRLQEKQA